MKVEDDRGLEEDAVTRELARRAKAGDEEAFGELYRSFRAPIFRLARFRLGDRAEDVVAETFLRAWAALPRYRDTGVPFLAWLYGIARHVIADVARAGRREELCENLPDRPVDHDSSLEDRCALAAALARLPDRQRQVIELKFLLGLTNEEVGAALGKTPGAVNTRQWRALEALRRMLELK